MKRYWMSWYQTTDDYRPLTYPPNGAILGWWCTGHRNSDDAATIVALVGADNEGAAKDAIKRDWSEASEWRICREFAPDETLGDRFPVNNDWMKERIAAQ